MPFFKLTIFTGFLRKLKVEFSRRRNTNDGSNEAAKPGDLPFQKVLLIKTFIMGVHIPKT
jgi:hypothetical protein